MVESVAPITCQKSGRCEPLQCTGAVDLVHTNHTANLALAARPKLKVTIETVEKDGLSLYPCLVNAHSLI